MWCDTLMIEVQNLCKRFGQFEAVRDACFSAASGEVLGFLGPNGAGKTTTLRMLTTYLPPSAGTALVGGFDIVGQAKQVRSVIGYLPERPPLYSELSVKEHLCLVGKLLGLFGSELQKRVALVCEQCSLDPVRRVLCGKLSKGFQQRVGLAATLIARPRVVILDEPTSGLDPEQVVALRDLIRELGKDHTVLLSTHVLQEVAAVCDRVVILAEGSVMRQFSLSELMDGKADPVALLERTFLRAVASSDAGTLNRTPRRAA